MSRRAAPALNAPEGDCAQALSAEASKTRKSSAENLYTRLQRSILDRSPCLRTAGGAARTYSNKKRMVTEGWRTIVTDSESEINALRSPHIGVYNPRRDP